MTGDLDPTESRPNKAFDLISLINEPLVNL
jgi:hypothetical protein